MEEEMRTAEMEQGDEASKGESSVEASNNSSTKRGRGRSQGSKKLAVCVADVNQTEQGSGISNGESAQNPSEKEEASGDQKAASNEDNADGLPNGEPARPKGKRGRPKGSAKRKLESAENEGSSVTRRESRSANKTPRLEKGAEAPRGRGRPRKVVQESGDGAQSVKKGRGRPKGSLNMKPPAYKVRGKVGRPRTSSPTKENRGRPKKQPAKRGRPRKNPLPSPEELKKPRVWKPLGRPRKYPRVDPPEEAPPPPRRGRGRPSKAESKKGAHLRKSVPASSPSSQTTNTETQRKRGRPKAQKSEAVTPVRRGRPKSSAKKSISSSEAQLDSSVEVEHGEQVENDQAATSNQEAGEEVSNQA